MKHFFLIFLILTIPLTSCSNSRKDNDSGSHNEDDLWLQQSMLSAALEPKDPDSVLIDPILYETTIIESADASYSLEYRIGRNEHTQLIGISSMNEHVLVPFVLEEYPYSELHTVVLNNLDIPNINKLTFSEGISIAKINDHIPNLKILELPASLTVFGSSSYTAQDMVNDYWARLSPTLIEDTELLKILTGYGDLSFTFPLTFKQLQEIHVAEGNAIFWDKGGILYSNNYAPLSPNTGAYPQNQLICLPQNYQNTVNHWIPIEKINLKQVNIPEGTDYIHTGAIYQCYSFDRLYIPDSVTRIAPAAIVATKDYPLTIVCSRNSAAAEYVAQFGKMYYLTVEYTD